MYKLQDTVNEVNELMISAAREVFAELGETLQNPKNPEKLIGKKFEQMTPQDLETLHTIMGEQKFDEWYVDKELPRVQKLEAS